jgi:hypothetical protein
MAFDHAYWEQRWEAEGVIIRKWQAECERLEAECGVVALRKHESAAQEAILRLRDRLAETPARTLAGLIFKAEYAKAHFPTEYDEVVAASLVDDLLAMADRPQPAQLAAAV